MFKDLKEKSPLLFTLLPIYAIIFIYSILPREQIQLSGIEWEVVNPNGSVRVDTFVVENPSWVKQQFQENSVTVTVYHAVEAQCDDSPDILADGTKIDLSKAGQYRYCALSRDLLERWDGPYAYGDTVWLEDAGHFSGPWIVKDTMNSRYTSRMDLLVDVGTRNYKFDIATIWKEL